MSEQTHSTVNTPAAAPVMQTPSGLLQRKCACGTHTMSGECEACGKGRVNLQRAATGSGLVTGNSGGIPSIVHDVLGSPGLPLDVETRAFFEPRFGRDFSQVRLHTDTKAAQSAQAVDARAFTVGPHVVFSSGQYEPGSHYGRQLLAHELTHVVQQAGVSPGAGLRVSSPSDASEQEAERSEKNFSSLASQTISASEPIVARQTGSTRAPTTSFEDCDPAMQADLRAKHPPAIAQVRLAIASLTPGWAGMTPTHRTSFTQFFDPANSGAIDDSFVSDVRSNYQRIGDYMRSLRFECDPTSWNLCGRQQGWCVGGRLMWTCWGNIHVCTNAYSTALDPDKIEAIIHESTHNALLTTDRAYYSNRSNFNDLRPRGSGIGRLWNILSNIPVLGLLFRVLPGNNDTINNPDSYASYAMHV